MSSSLPSNKTYLDLIYEAILTLQTSGSSITSSASSSTLPSIKKYIQEQYPDLELKAHYLRAALKKAVTDKKIIQLKGSYRLSAAEIRTSARRPTIMTNVLSAQKGTPKQKKTTPSTPKSPKSPKTTTKKSKENSKKATTKTSKPKPKPVTKAKAKKATKATSSKKPSSA